MATKIFPNEIACKIPGVTPVLNFVPWQSDMRVATEEKTVDDYTLTKDETFQSGKEYYKKGAGRDFTVAEAGKDYIVDDPMITGKFYEKSQKTANFTTTTIYDRYTTGVIAEFDKTTGYPKAVERPVEIIKTVVETDGANQMTTRWHTLALWDDRETATYIPYCDRLDTDIFREAGRIMR